MSIQEPSEHVLGLSVGLPAVSRRIGLICLAKLVSQHLVEEDSLSIFLSFSRRQMAGSPDDVKIFRFFFSCLATTFTKLLSMIHLKSDFDTTQHSSH